MALLVKTVARALAGEKGGEDLPPKVRRRIEAHGLEARIGQAVEPIVEVGQHRLPHPVEGLGGQRRVHARERFAARRFATWLWMSAREWRVTWRMSV